LWPETAASGATGSENNMAEILDDDLKAELATLRESIDPALERLAESWTGPEPLAEMMRHALHSGGKRLRPALVLAASQATGESEHALDRALVMGCALELVHTYSLVHDDLPAMDDDDERRGLPTVHKLHGDAVGVLTGDALLTEAFRVVAEEGELSDRARVRATGLLARAAGHEGMVAGQVRDIGATFETLASLRQMHAEKTGALFQVACELGGVAVDASPLACGLLRHYGSFLGAAFQVSDDILDVVEAGGEVDEHERAVNIACRIGTPLAVEWAVYDSKAAIQCLNQLPGDTSFLSLIARWVASRAEAALQ
jgi:geranylgeranyl diphosphate synthase type II